MRRRRHQTIIFILLLDIPSATRYPHLSPPNTASLSTKGLYRPFTLLPFPVYPCAPCVHSRAPAPRPSSTCGRLGSASRCGISNETPRGSGYTRAQSLVHRRDTLLASARLRELAHADILWPLFH